MSIVSLWKGDRKVYKVIFIVLIFTTVFMMANDCCANKLSDTRTNIDFYRNLISQGTIDMAYTSRQIIYYTNQRDWEQVNFYSLGLNILILNMGWWTKHLAENIQKATEYIAKIAGLMAKVAYWAGKLAIAEWQLQQAEMQDNCERIKKLKAEIKVLKDTIKNAQDDIMYYDG